MMAHWVYTALVAVLSVTAVEVTSAQSRRGTPPADAPPTAPAPGNPSNTAPAPTSAPASTIAPRNRSRGVAAEPTAAGIARGAIAAQESPQQAIQRLTAAIDSGQLQGEALNEALLERALHNVNTGRMGFARQDIEAVLRTDRQSPEVHYVKGLSLYVSNPAAAAASFAEVIRLEPGSVRGHFGRAWSHLSASRFRDAVTDFDQVLRSAPDDLEAWRGRSWALLHDDRPDAAVESFTQLLARRAVDADALTGRGLAHYLAGRSTSARVDFRSAMRMRPKPPYNMNRNDNTVRLEDFRRYTRAGVIVDARLQRNVRDAEAWLVMGVLDYHGGGTPAASSFNRALTLRPDDIDALMARGLLYTYGIFNPVGAIADFTEVIRLNPALSEAYFRRALVTALNKDALPSAIADCEKALALSPDDPTIKQVLARLRTDQIAWEQAKTDAAIAQAQRDAAAESYAAAFFFGLAALMATSDGYVQPTESYLERAAEDFAAIPEIEEPGPP